MRSLPTILRPTTAIVAVMAVVVLILFTAAFLPLPARISQGNTVGCFPVSLPVGDVRLAGHIPPIVIGRLPTGYLSCQQQLRLSIALKIQNPTALDALLAAQNDPTSPFYHQYLTPQEFADRFAPSQHEIDALMTYLKQWNITTSESANHMNIQITGTVAAIQQAFFVRLAKYQLTSRVVFAPTTDPALPREFTASVQSIIGLDDVAQMHPVP